MNRINLLAIAIATVLLPSMLAADDLSGSKESLCTS